MTKSDKSKHTICIASIKRCTIKPYDFIWTKFYEMNSDFQNSYPTLEFEFKENELVICSTIIDPDNFSVLTTQRLITSENGVEAGESLLNATNKGSGDFKGYQNTPLTFGVVGLENGLDLKYFIETGRASMVMIYGVRTMLQIQQMTTDQMDQTAKIWIKKSE